MIEMVLFDGNPICAFFAHFQIENMSENIEYYTFWKSSAIYVSNENEHSKDINAQILHVKSL